MVGETENKISYTITSTQKVKQQLSVQDGGNVVQTFLKILV